MAKAVTHRLYCFRHLEAKVYFLCIAETIKDAEAVLCGILSYRPKDTSTDAIKARYQLLSDKGLATHKHNYYKRSAWDVKYYETKMSTHDLRLMMTFIQDTQTQDGYTLINSKVTPITPTTPTYDAAH